MAANLQVATTELDTASTSAMQISDQNVQADAQTMMVCYMTVFIGKNSRSQLPRLRFEVLMAQPLPKLATTVHISHQHNLQKINELSIHLWLKSQLF